MSIKRLKTHIYLWLMKLPWKGTKRHILARRAGINLPSKPTFIYIGRNVIFDSIHPELITIEDRVHITEGCIFLTHYLSPIGDDIIWKYGKVVIKEGAFIGARTIITKPCTIGLNSIVGAGSVVTKDIPDNEIWAGNPTHFIRKRGGSSGENNE